MRIIQCADCGLDVEDAGYARKRCPEHAALRTERMRADYDRTRRKPYSERSEAYKAHNRERTNRANRPARHNPPRPRKSLAERLQNAH